MDSPDRNNDTPMKSRLDGSPPHPKTAHSNSKRDRRTQIAARNRGMNRGKMPKMLCQDSTAILPADTKGIEREELDTQGASISLNEGYSKPFAVPSKRDRSWDSLDSSAISEASHSEEEEPSWKRRRVGEAVPEDLDVPADTAKFVIYPDEDLPHATSSRSDHHTGDIEVNIEKGSCVECIHNPAKAVTWLEENWNHSLLISMRKSGYNGPFAQMLFRGKPALALFGSCDAAMQESAEELGKLSKFPVVIRPSSDAPKSILSHDSDAGNDFGGYRGRGSVGDGGEEERRGRVAAEVPVNLGATGMDRPWESRHSTDLKLQLKTNNGHGYAVDIGYNFKFHIYRGTDLAIGRANLDRPLSDFEVIALTDFKIETRPWETLVDRSYSSIGLVAHREASINSTTFTDTVEATKSKIMPKCPPDCENEDGWDEDRKSYSSYNIASEPQHMRLDPLRSEVQTSKVKVGMGINLKPPGSKTPQISFIHRNQILVWVSDPALQAKVRGIVVSMSSYVNDIRREGWKTTKRRQGDLLTAGTPYPAQGKRKNQPRPRLAIITAPSRILRNIRKIASSLRVAANLAQGNPKRRRLLRSPSIAKLRSLTGASPGARFQVTDALHLGSMPVVEPLVA
ncbi:hypothetical protein B0H19DRAFT_1374657 [Mycena capillaripes]|nr:hypothetical protein B0H19DRAFT_1374657 [Mycena capillaripes]